MPKKERKSLAIGSLRGDEGSSASMNHDPLERMPIKASILDIEKYHLNPRKQENPEFESIKKSISQIGLEQMFTVTRRPGDNHYTIAKGGNTRLKALKELYDETGDEKFKIIDVVFEPWISETANIISHIVENETRGQLIFIDRAWAISELKTNFESEKNKTISSRDLANRSSEMGYEINHVIIQAMLYAVRELYEFIPELLNAGLGRGLVEKIRKLSNDAEKVWLHLNGGNKDGFKSLLTEALKEQDQLFIKNTDNTFSIDKLWRSLDNLICDKTELDCSEFSSLLDLEQNGGGLSSLEQISAPTEEKNNTSASIEALEPEEKFEDKTPFNDDLDDLDNESSEDELEEFQLTQETEDTKKEPDGNKSKKDASEPPKNNSEPEFEPIPTKPAPTLGALRESAFLLAKKIASAASSDDRFSHIIKKCGGVGHGFYLNNIVTDTCLPNGIDDPKDLDFQRISNVWLLLFQLSGGSNPTLRESLKQSMPLEFLQNDLVVFLKHVDNDDDNDMTPYRDNFIHDAMKGSLNNTRLFNDFILFNDEYDHLIDDALELIKTIRTMQKLAKNNLIDLWPVKEGGQDE